MHIQSIDPSNKITILLYLPEQIVLKVNVCQKARIRSLRKALPKDQKFEFYYQGTFLSDSFSFDQYHIKHSSIITALNSKSLKTDQNWFKRHNQCAELIHEKLRSAADPRQKVELLKLHDIQMMSIESQPTKYRNLIKNFEIQQHKQKQIGQVIQCFYRRPKKPLTDPLPIFWVETPYTGPLCPDEGLEQLKNQQSRSLDIVC